MRRHRKPLTKRHKDWVPRERVFSPSPGEQGCGIFRTLKKGPGAVELDALEARCRAGWSISVLGYKPHAQSIAFSKNNFMEAPVSSETHPYGTGGKADWRRGERY
jgi:hypothetical protein